MADYTQAGLANLIFDTIDGLKRLQPSQTGGEVQEQLIRDHLTFRFGGPQCFDHEALALILQQGSLRVAVLTGRSEADRPRWFRVPADTDDWSRFAERTQGLALDAVVAVNIPRHYRHFLDGAKATLAPSMSCSNYGPVYIELNCDFEGKRWPVTPGFERANP